MNETSKTKLLWDSRTLALFEGRGIDIGCGTDPVSTTAKPFDIQHGDANEILRYVDDQFDYVFSSHCLEHMHKPPQAVRDWWELVRPGGVMILIVPDEDLYEQGLFPSRFNPDHKATFTIAKHSSWSSHSINFFSLLQALPDAVVESIQLQDAGYDRSLQTHGPLPFRSLQRFLSRLSWFIQRHAGRKLPFVPWMLQRLGPVDQTLGKATAQIQAIVRKTLSSPPATGNH